MKSTWLEEFGVYTAYSLSFNSSPPIIGYQISDEDLRELMRQAVLSGKPVTAEVLDEFTGQAPYPDGVWI